MSGNVKNVLSYTNKIMLAPMVRIGTLPMRLLSLRYGADIVYGEEIIDHKMILCTRLENRLLGTIDFMASDGTVIFRTCDEEKDKLIFQMGTSDPDRALKVAKMMEKDVSGIDINMGCPKEFSIKGGMGAALLDEPDKIKTILTKLVSELSIPITCKIRILPELSTTLELVKMIETTGIKALGVHGRWKEERSSLPCHTDYIKKISETISIPLIANGGGLIIKDLEGVQKFKEDTGSSSVMLARSAMWNPSIFRMDHYLMNGVTKEYVKLAIEYDSPFQNVKYVLCKMIGDMTKCSVGKQVQFARDLHDIAVAYDLEDFQKDILRKRKELKEQIEADEESREPKSKKFKMDSLIIMDSVYNRKIYPDTVSPVQLVYDYCKRKQFDQPVFNSLMTEDRMFKSEMVVDGKTYTSKFNLRKKKHAEQTAAVVFLKYHNIHDGRLKT